MHQIRAVSQEVVCQELSWGLKMKDLTSPRRFCSQFIWRKAQRAEWGLDRSFLLICILNGKKTYVWGEGEGDMAIGWE